MKRINVKLVTSLAIGLVVSMGLIVALHEYQSNRRAAGLLERASVLEEKGEYGNSLKLINNYLKRRPDDKEQYGRMALTLKKMIENSRDDGKPLDPTIVRRTLAALELALRKTPNDLELRDAAVEFDMQFYRFGDAIDHLEYLIDSEERKDDSQLRVKLAECYFRSGKEDEATELLKQLIGYDDASRSFRPDQAMAPNEINAYVLLARILERKQRQDTATAVINQLVRANSDNHEAYLARAGFFSAFLKDDIGAARDVDKALELAPDNEVVVLAAAEFAMQDGKFDRAKTMFDRLSQINSENVRAYIGLSRWAAAQKDYEQAIEYLQTAKEKAPKNLEVLWQRSNTELQMGDVDAASETSKELAAAGAPAWYVNFLDGRVAVARNKWLLASEKLESARPMVVQFLPKLTTLLDMNLAAAYEQLGKHDVRLSVLERVLESKSDNSIARLSKAQAHAAMGQVDAAIRDYDMLRSREMDPKALSPKTLIAYLELEILKQRNADEAQRDWKSAANLVRTLGQNPQVPRELYAQIMASYLQASGQEQRAAEVRAKIREQNPDNISYVMEDIMQRSTQPDGYAEAMEDLQQLRSQKGDLIAFRLLEANIVTANRPEDMKERLLALEEQVDSFNDREKATLWYQLGRLHVGLREYDDARRLWRQFADLQPENTEHMIRLFELAIISNDDESAKSAMNRFAEQLPKGRESAEWKWARAAFVTKEVRAQDLPMDKLVEANALLDEAIVQRDKWEPLYRLQGEIHMLNEDFDAAIESYEKALTLGSTNAEAYRRLARLYYERRDFDRSKVMLNKLGRAQWEPMDQKIHVDILARLGELTEDFEYDKNSRDPNDHLTIGGIMMRAGRLDEAENAFRKAIELDPTRATTWGSLFELLYRTERSEEARKVLEEAKTKVAADNLPMLLGTSYHMLGAWDASVAEYEKALEKSPDNLTVLTSLARVNLAAGRREEAASILQKIIGKEDPHLDRPQRSVAWARRALAEMISENSTYEEYKKALELIEDNAPAGSDLRPDDLLVYAQISARRPEAITHRETIRKLEQAGDKRRLSDNELLVLAELYKRQDRWTQCKSVMLDLLTRHADDARYIIPWLSWVIDEKDYASAKTWLKKIPEDSLPAIRARAHLLAASGKVNEAFKLIGSIIPKERTAQEVPQLAAIAGMLEELGAFDPKGYALAQRIWQVIQKLEPRRSLQVASFYNRQDNSKYAQLALEQCQTSFQLGKGRQLPSLQMALFVLRKHYGALMRDSKNEQMVRSMFEQAETDQPESGTLLVLRSEFEDLTGNGQKSRELLEAFLQRSNTHPRERALVQNNLAYKLALAGEAERPAELIDEAMNALGPRSDLLDTKGIVLIAQARTDEAVKLFEQAIADGGPSGMKYFHLALAYWEAGDKSSAATAMQDALEMEVDPATMVGSEKRRYDDLLRDLRREGLIPTN